MKAKRDIYKSEKETNEIEERRLTKVDSQRAYCHLEKR